jgi:thioredoxin 1
MATQELTRDNFEAAVEKGGTLLIDWWATWCPPCRAFAPVFEAASEKYPDITFAKIDTDAQQELAAAFNIRSIPTLMVFREKVLLYAEAGMLPAPVLDDLIQQARALDMAEVHRDIAARKAAEEKVAPAGPAEPGQR